jgi:REP element-mobilizing transposase RayT
MPRIPRIFVKGPEVAYHVISRTALDGFVLGPQEKDYLLSLIRWLSSVFFVEVFGFCIMGNHFHLLCRMLPPENFSDDEVLSRIKRYYGEDHEIKDLSLEKLSYWRSRLSDLSRYVQEIKQRFSRWYNKRKGRKGYFWGDRFKSVIIETGEALLNCLAYIDLNPVRAGLVERPEDYRWCSLAYHIGTGNKGGFLSTDLGVAAFTNKGYQERIGFYREYVYEKGGIRDGSVGAIPEEVLEEEREKGYRLTRKEVFRYRVRYFTEGLIIGSRNFVRETAEKVRELLKLKRKRRPRKVGLVEGLYSFRAVG